MTDVSDALIDEERNITIATLDASIVNFKPELVETPHNIRGVVQIPQDDVLKVLGLDFSQEYRQVHIRAKFLNFTIKNEDLLKNYKGKDYKIIKMRNFIDYGYFEFICEEVKSGN